MKYFCPSCSRHKDESFFVGGFRVGGSRRCDPCEACRINHSTVNKEKEARRKASHRAAKSNYKAGRIAPFMKD